MAEDKIVMPSSMGGLVRYFDEYHSKIQLKPVYVVLIIILVVVTMIGVRSLFPLG